MPNKYIPRLLKVFMNLYWWELQMHRRSKKALKHYTLCVLCPEQKLELTNGAYYPTTTDVSNHIYKAQRVCQLSNLDQENLQLK